MNEIDTVSPKAAIVDGDTFVTEIAGPVISDEPPEGAGDVVGALLGLVVDEMFPDPEAGRLVVGLDPLPIDVSGAKDSGESGMDVETDEVEVESVSVVSTTVTEASSSREPLSEPHDTMTVSTTPIVKLVNN